jgi:hypothetical protein
MMMTDDTSGPDAPRYRQRDEDPIHAVRDALSAIRYGAIQLTVHDGRLVQMDVTEKRRFAA